MTDMERCALCSVFDKRLKNREHDFSQGMSVLICQPQSEDSRTECITTVAQPRNVARILKRSEQTQDRALVKIRLGGQSGERPWFGLRSDCLNDSKSPINRGDTCGRPLLPRSQDKFSTLNDQFSLRIHHRL